MRVKAPKASIAAIERRIRRSRAVESFAYISPSDAYDEAQHDDSFPADVKAAITRVDLPASFRMQLHDASERRDVAAQFRGLHDVELTRAGITCAYVRRQPPGEFPRKMLRAALQQCITT